MESKHWEQKESVTRWEPAEQNATAVKETEQGSKCNKRCMQDREEEGEELVRATKPEREQIQEGDPVFQ